jgi:broad specificity phosphatase PhoE
VLTPPCPAADTCCIYLVRHGATDNNLARPPRLQGCGLDAALSVEGRRQAQRTAEFLADRGLNVVYSSPLLRARQTAQAIAAASGLAVELVDEIIEVDIGQWEGMTWNEVERTHPKEYEAFLNDAGLHPFLGGETLEQVRARVVPALNRLMEANLGRTVAIVAHNVVNRAYLAHLMELPLSCYRAIPQDNCGITVLRHRQGRTRLVTLNGLFHLDRTTSSSG